jgi:hypothetical protein
MELPTTVEGLLRVYGETKMSKQKHLLLESEERSTDAISALESLDSRTVASTFALFLLILARLMIRASLSDVDDRKSA